jgi:ABC-2 type transport system permease protein
MSVLLRLRAAFRKELLQFFRAKVLVLLVVYMFAEIANCAWALTMDLRNYPLLVVDEDRTSTSRALAERFRIAPYFAYRYAASSLDPAAALELGDAALVVTIPPGLGRALERGEPATVQLVADGTYSNFARQAIGTAGDIIQSFDMTIAMDASVAGPAMSGVPAIVNQVRLWYMPGLEYTHSQMISMLSISALILGVLLPAAAIVREKEAGTLEQLLVSPLGPTEFVAAKLLPTALLLLVGIGIGLLEARLLFATPMNGSLALFFGMSVLLLFTSMGLGAYIGAVTRNLLQALLVTFALLFPMIFLSGTVVPTESMPLAVQWITYLSPLRYYLPIAQGILFKGVGLDVLAPNALALGAYGVLLLTIGVRQLRHTLAV